MSDTPETETTTISVQPQPFGTATSESCITYESIAFARERQKHYKRQRIAMRQNVNRKAKRKAQRRARHITRRRRG